MYGHVCGILAAHNKDCTIIDVGCGNLPNLYEIKRHLSKHNIRCKTIGIDVDICDIEVDRFVHRDVRDVKIPCTADIVISRHVFDMCNTKTKFSNVVRASADMLKKDGLMITETYSSDALKSRCGTFHSCLTQTMTKTEAINHAKTCYKTYYDKCQHGSIHYE